MIDKAAAMELVKRAAVSYGVNGCEFLGAGSFGFVFRFYGKDGKIFAAKVTEEESAKREARELKKLSEICSVKVPCVYSCEVIDGYGCILMDYIDGISAYDFRAYLHGKKKRRAFAVAVADGVHDILARKEPKFGDMDAPTFDNWLDYYRPIADKIMAGIRESHDTRAKKIQPIMEKLYARFDDIFAEKVEYAALIHGDLCPMNMLVNKRTLTLKAFIDPLDMRYADGEYELFQLFCQSGRYFKLYETYKELYPVSKNCDIKTAFYAVFAEAEFFLKDGVYIGSLVRPLIRRAKRELKKFMRQEA